MKKLIKIFVVSMVLFPALLQADEKQKITEYPFKNYVKIKNIQDLCIKMPKDILCTHKYKDSKYTLLEICNGKGNNGIKEKSIRCTKGGSILFSFEMKFRDYLKQQKKKQK